MAVYTYSLKKDGDKYLSPHFQVKEFRCKDGSDKILINHDLIAFLEKLFTHLNAKAINITSGYRTPAHSVRVGGYRTDQHTKGNAADITAKKQNGTYFTSNEICLACEDLNHKGGVGRINKQYSVHIDARGYKCWFDETNKEKTTNSWYAYFGVKKPVAQQAVVTKPKTTQNTVKPATTKVDAGYIYADKNHPVFGVDFSKHNGAIDWTKMKDRISFAILRVGYGSDYKSQDDEQFAANVAACEKYGIPYGVYLYSYADTLDKAISEADHALRLLKGHKLVMPVYYDLEEEKQARLGKDTILTFAKAFEKKITAAGYTFGVYASLYWWKTYLTDAWYNGFSRWVAQYNKSCTYTGKYDIWQYGYDKIDGFTGEFDGNWLYTSFGIRKGDIDGDGKVTSKDAAIAAQAAARQVSLDNKKKEAADVDDDGKVTAKDAREILREAAKLK